MNIPEYRAGVRAKYAQLQVEYSSGFLFVNSLKTAYTTPGHVVEVSTENCARLLVDGTHRIATEAEIEEFRLRSEARKRDLEAAEIRKLPSTFRVTLRSR